MRVVKYWDESAELWSFVGTGDGTDEFPTLKAMAERYDGTCTLLFPKASRRKKTGLSVLDSINTVITKTSPKINTFLFLIDREHIVQGMKKRDLTRLNTNKIQGMIEKRLSNKHVRILETDNNTPDGTFIIKGKLGSRILHIYIVIFGIKSIEDEILTLIKLEKDITIPPGKKNIRDFFEERFHTRSIGRGAGKLIIEADESNIQKSFPGLTFILNAIEKQCSENN